MQKRKISTLLVIVMMSALFISGLGVVGFAASEQEGMNMWILAMQPGTSLYSYALTISRLLSETLPPNSRIEVIPRGGSAANPTILNEGGADIALCSSYLAAKAYRGIGEYEGRGPATNIRSVTGNMDIVYTWFLALKSYVDKTGFTTLEEMFSGPKNEWPRVGMKPAGSTVPPDTDMLLRRTLGISLDEVRDAGKLIQAQPAQIAEMLRDGRLDIYFESAALNHAGLTEVTLTNDMVFIPYPKEGCEYLLENGMYMATVPPGGYRGLTEYVTPASGNVIIANKNAPEDMIYLLIKTLVERREELARDNAALSGWNPEEYSLGMVLPLHPGAKRYYDERGW